MTNPPLKLIKRNFAVLTFLFFVHAAIAQEYILENVRDKLIYGVVRTENNGVGVVYKDGSDNITFLKLDQDLQLVSENRLSLSLTIEDEVEGSCFNGKTVLVSITHPTGYVTRNTNGIITSERVYENYFTTVDLNNKVAGRTGSQSSSAATYSKFPVAARGGTGYYILSQTAVIKFNNYLRQEWVYYLPKGYFLSLIIPAANSTNSIGSGDLFVSDSTAFTFVIVKKKNAFSVEKADERMISLESGSGNEKFNYAVDVTEPKTFYDLTERNGKYYLSGVMGAITGKNPGLDRTYQLVLDNQGKLIAEHKQSYAPLKEEILKGKKWQAFYRDIYVSDSSSLLVFEKAQEDKFLVFFLDADFSIIKEKTVAREHSDLKTALSGYASMFAGGDMSKMFTDDYRQTISLDPQGNSFLLMYKMIDKKFTHNSYEYRSSYVSLDETTEGENKVYLKFKDYYPFFTRATRFYTLYSSDKSFFIFAYTLPDEDKLVLRKTLLK